MAPLRFKNSQELYERAYKFEHGINIGKNINEAMESYLLSALKGNPDALKSLRRLFEEYPKYKSQFLYRHGMEPKKIKKLRGYMGGFFFEHGLIVQQSVDEALYRYRLAADNADGDGQYALGMMYLNGFDNEQSYEEAFSLLTRASNKDHHYAKYWLGVLYEFGLGCEQSMELALHHYESAGCIGIPRAAYRLFIINYFGYGVPRSIETSKIWFRKYVENSEYRNDDPECLFLNLTKNLEILDKKFHMISKDHPNYKEVLCEYALEGYDPAFKELMELANQDDGTAQLYMGRLIENSKNPADRNITAVVYYDKAAKKGNEEAHKSSQKIHFYIKNLENTCPLCGSSLVYKPGKNGGTFKGCSRWPECEYTTQSCTPCVCKRVNPVELYYEHCMQTLIIKHVD